MRPLECQRKPTPARSETGQRHWRLAELVSSDDLIRTNLNRRQFGRPHDDQITRRIRRKGTQSYARRRKPLNVTGCSVEDARVVKGDTNGATRCPLYRSEDPEIGSS